MKRSIKVSDHYLKHVSVMNPSAISILESFYVVLPPTSNGGAVEVTGIFIPVLKPFYIETFASIKAPPDKGYPHIRPKAPIEG